MSHVGRNLTLHHEINRYASYPNDPKELLHVVDNGSIPSCKSLGRTAIIDPPISYVIYRAPHRYTKDKIVYRASTRDPRVGTVSSLDSKYYDWPHTLEGKDADTPGGAVASFRKSLSEWILRVTGKDDPTIVVTEREHIPNNDRSKVVDCLNLATHVYLIEDSNWGYHYAEVCVGSGRMDLVRTQGSPLVDAYEIKSCRADFTSDKKWQQYLPYCHRLSFVTVKGAILPEELPEDIGLFYLNPKYRQKGEVKRHTSEMALICVRRPKMRPTELKHILASIDNMLRKGGPIKFEKDVYDRLETKLQGVYGE